MCTGVVPCTLSQWKKWHAAYDNGDTGMCTVTVISAACEKHQCHVHGIVIQSRTLGDAMDNYSHRGSVRPFTEHAAKVMLVQCNISSCALMMRSSLALVCCCPVVVLSTLVLRTLSTSVNKITSDQQQMNAKLDRVTNAQDR